MSTSIVTGDGFSASSNHESGEEMVSALKPIKDADSEPKITQDRGKPVEESEKDAAAVALGKKGGEAAAAKRVADAKAAKKAAAEVPEPDEPEAAAAAGDEKDRRTGNPRHDSQARIAELARGKKDAEERAERAERRAAEVERSSRTVQAPQEPRHEPQAPRQTLTADPADPKPSEDNFNTYADFLDARDDWRDRQKERQTQQRSEAHARVERVATVVDGFVDRIAGVPRTDPAHREKLAEFMAGIAPEVADLTPSFQLPPGQTAGPLNAIADEIVQSERAPALLLHFTQHPEEFQRVAALRTPRDIARAMATIETRLEAADAATSPSREPSRAKPPVRAVTGSPHAVESAPAADDPDYEAHKRYWSARR